MFVHRNLFSKKDQDLSGPAQRTDLHPISAGDAPDRLADLGRVLPHLAGDDGRVDTGATLHVDLALGEHGLHHLGQHPGVCGVELHLGHGRHGDQGV